MESVNQKIIDDLLEEARKDPRLRKAKALKPADYTGVRPLLNAMLPGTYVRPHRHGERLDEYWLVLRGKLAPIYFTDEGDIKNYEIVSESSRDVSSLVYIPEKNFHSLVVIDNPAVILEITQGPYDPKIYKEFAPWAPLESDIEGSKKYLDNLLSRLNIT
ncbi:MAG: WbuC family cupin fold metalloprotein [Nanoarchaeota archaeon]